VIAGMPWLTQERKDALIRQMQNGVILSLLFLFLFPKWTL
jgi:hypothetical protein